MYVLATNQIVKKFPYSIGDLRKDNPQTSFPANPSLALLAEFNIFPVVSTGSHHDPKTQIANLDGCVFNTEKNRWETKWSVRNKTAEQIQIETDDKAINIRDERNKLLSECDWTQLEDVPEQIKTAYVQYRQALRDISNQSGFPWNVNWPEKPE